MKKVRRNDTVVLLAGRDRGRSGKVLRVLDDRVVVEGVNLVKHFVKQDPNRGVEGGILEQEASVHVSNVALLNPQTNRADRVGFKVLEDGKKVRCFKSNGEQVDVV
ncbi:MAG: 50S ribosomal protein L24 [Gammaproteobacteria bacterium RIFCSPHIGHO2_12_FULL_45_9]|nr:MAG: 50S ribosomal protein L24 [Gammaproteobacteria bacterium RIFCSPHIGHO2_12_FULL_45_9]